MNDKESRYKILGFAGQAGAGKDTAVRWFNKHNIRFYNIFHKAVGVTTRPPREKEKDGVDYFFVDNNTFSDMVLNNEVLEATSFNEWFYGTPKKGLDKNLINILPLNPIAISILQDCPEVDLGVVYLQATDRERLLRQLMREPKPDCDEIVRRYATDKIDFDDFNEMCYDYIYILNHDDYLQCFESPSQLAVLGAYLYSKKWIDEETWRDSFCK